MSQPIRVLVWNEFEHEKVNQRVKELYPDGIHAAIAAGLAEDSGLRVNTATLEQPDHGLTEAVLQQTDVLTWWGHRAHGKVQDAIVDRVQQRVLEGMGLIVLHSGHMSKIFRRMLGSSGALMWREAGERERLWNIEPGHPITQGVGQCIELPASEMYGERFDVPRPDELLFISWFEGGEVFRSGCTWQRGHGKIFYFGPGHETYPIYHNPEILRVIRNAVHWAAPLIRQPLECTNPAPRETLSPKQ